MRIGCLRFVVASLDGWRNETNRTGPRFAHPANRTRRCVSRANVSDLGMLQCDTIYAIIVTLGAPLKTLAAQRSRR